MLMLWVKSKNFLVMLLQILTLKVLCQAIRLMKNGF